MNATRRAALLSHASAQIMRAAGHAASEQAKRNVGDKIIRGRLDDLALKFVPRTTDLSRNPMRLPYLSDKAAQRLGLQPGQYVPSLMLPAR